MKKAFAILALAAMIFAAGEGSSTCWAELPTVGGAAISYNAVGPDHDAGNSWNTYYYAGTRLFHPDSTSSVYAIVHYLNVNGTGTSGWGGKAALVSKIKSTDFYLLSGLGFLTTVAQNADGSLTTAFYADFGASWEASSMIDVAIGLQAVDRGPEFALAIHGSFIVKELSRLIP